MATTVVKFIAAVKAMENRTSRVKAFVILNPQMPAWHGRIVVSYPQDGMGRLNVIAWLPGENGSDVIQHAGSASGCGYDKATAAMGGAEFYDMKQCEMSRLIDQGHDFRHQLEAAGYHVIQAV